ncbi:MAG: hypothetical protein EWV85_03000 [Microcystis aeruginosa Ma_QC_C_20070703_M131]|uniref:Uncharacterized protein n=1 Tax=Microcystis aeruginosa Ma_QC_C_20070703_M131 TaxID=2486263 RepID=A0A551YKJ5_MICAE|nr:MAG: hypothetical protein EWV85_03000 [Microcystis aeruginosa Ma_QC_C_20070703_M131]
MLGSGKWEVGRINKNNLLTPISCLLNPLSNAQKTGFSEKPVFYSCTHAKRGINNQSLITRFSMTPDS